MLPDEEQLSNALEFLAKTDAKFADACATVEATEMKLKVIRDTAYLESSGSAGERAAIANTTAACLEAQTALVTAVREKRLLEAQRKRAEMIKEVWQTLEASRRRGNI